MICSNHLKLVAGELRRKDLSDSTEECVPVTIQDLRRSNNATSQHFLTVHGEMAKLEEEMNCQLWPFRERITKLESSWAECEKRIT